MKDYIVGSLSVATFALALAGGIEAQEAPQLLEARAALEECARHAESATGPGQGTPEGKSSFERAEKAFRAAITAAPRAADAHAGLGETLVRCGIPQANMTTIMAVVEQANAAFRSALEIDPRHWRARFMTAVTAYNMPPFMNQLPVAIRELETLLRQQEERGEPAHYAQTWIYLGDAYLKSGRAEDARTVFTTGARLFPDNAALQERVRDHGAARDTTIAALATAPAEAPAVHALAPLRVEGAQHQLEAARSGTSLRRLDVYTMPGGTGEMLQTLQTQPGATRAGDGADLYVRGGDPEETPVFVNGGRVAYPGRWESLNGATMGVIDATVLSKAYFSAGGFSAKFGNALSGIVDVETQGRPEQAAWRVGANMVSAGASLYRPVGSAAGAWGTVMLTDVTLLTHLEGTADEYPSVPRSWQLFAGGSVDVTPSLELKAVAVGAGDEAGRVIDTGGYRGTFHSEGTTQHAALSARWLRADSRIGVTGGLAASRRETGFDFGLLRRDREDEALGARVDTDVILTDATRVRGGLELTRFGAVTSGRVPLTRDLNPGSPSQLLDRLHEDDVHTGGYVEAEHALSSSLVGVLGLRADRLPGTSGTTLDPRAALAYTSGGWTLRAAGGLFHQGAWRRTYQLPDAGTPSGVATQARHLVLGAERAGEPAIRVEAYAKQYDDYVATGSGGPAIEDGVVRGIDAIVRWQRQSRLNGWITYSLLDSELTLADGSTAPTRFDVTHSVTGVARLALGEAWEVGSTVRYATGKPHTPVVGSRDAQQQGWPREPVYGRLHSERLPHYLRLDGRITRYQPIAGRTAVLYLEMLDLNGRRNIVGWQYDDTWTRREPVESFFARRTFVLGAELGF